MIIYRTLKMEELDAWFAHCQGVFMDNSPNYFRNHFEMDPYGDPSMIFVAMDGEEIAATVRVFRRTIWLHGRAVKMGGIGEVSTKPAYRRQGLVSELLQMAIAAMERDEIPVSILFGDEGIYERAGWRFPTEDRTALPSDELVSLPRDVSVRAFVPDDLPFLMGIYDLYAGRMDGALIRSKAYWRSWVLPQWTPPQVLLQDAHPVAYACTTRDAANATVYVREMGAAPQAEALLPGLFKAATELGDTIRFSGPVLDGYAQYTEQVEGGMMVRLNLPVEGCMDSDCLVANLRHPGMCAVDHF